MRGDQGVPPSPQDWLVRVYLLTSLSLETTTTPRTCMPSEHYRSHCHRFTGMMHPGSLDLIQLSDFLASAPAGGSVATHASRILL
jgi:hypothetical protein